MKRNAPQDVWRFIDVRGQDECWPWTGVVNTGGGYGYIGIGGTSYLAHRVVFALTYPGSIEFSAPTDKYLKQFVLHRCDNRPCCNPKHMFLGNYHDNNMDKAIKGRCNAPKGDAHHFRKSLVNAPRGERNGKSVFTEWDIRFIKHWLNAGYPHRNIAASFGSGKTTILHIKSGRTWSHVNA